MQNIFNHLMLGIFIFLACPVFANVPLLPTYGVAEEIYLTEFPRLEGETSDNGRLTRAIAEAMKGSILNLGNSTLEISSPGVSISHLVDIRGDCTSKNSILQAVGN